MNDDLEGMVVCYGCLYPMHASFEVVEERVGTPRPYCLRCYVWRRLKGVGPQDHDPGEVSNGTLTMRQRPRQPGHYDRGNGGTEA